MSGPSEQERLRAAMTETPGGMRPSEQCLESETIWAAVTGELPPATFRGVAAHAIDCAVCSHAWALARDLAAEANLGPGAGADERLPGRPWRAWWGLAAAAAALAVVALTFQVGQGPLSLPPDDPSFRAPTEEPVRSLLPAGAALPRGACILRWSGPEGARYDLTVSTEDLRVLARVEGLEVTEYGVAEEELAGVPPGGSFVWQVEGVLEDGTRLASRSYLQLLAE